MIRVAYIVHIFAVGGIERCVAHLSNHLDRRHFQPTIIALTHNGRAADWIEQDDVSILELHKRTGNDLGALRRLAKVLRDREIDVVHSHNWGTLIETSVARRWAKVPVHVHTEHGQGLHHKLSGLKQRLRGRAEGWAFERANAVVICAESVRHQISVRSGFAESRMLYLPNGVEDPLQHPMQRSRSELRRELGIPDSACVVGSVGRFVDVKDFASAVAATAPLDSGSAPVHLVLVGDGPNRQSLADQAQSLGIAHRVHLVGWQARVGDWLRLFDVYINCSRSEAMSMGILEAMAAGLPCVVTDVGDNRLLIEGTPACGMAVSPGSPERLTAGLRRVLEDVADHRSMADAARYRFEAHYTAACMARRHEQLYADLLDGR
ncbi:MAG: glycosyltransferase, partial [Planctomycetaceae bacterium]|nr:glycosyltransferase [Planctomycetaceae bacterium]